MAGSYSITQSDLRFSNVRLAQLTDDNGAVIDTTKVDAAIVAAEDEFHLYAGVYYATPVRDSGGAVPAGIRLKLIEAARCFLLGNRPESLRSDEDEGDQWEARRREHITWLKSIADADPKDRLPIPGAVEKSAGDTTARGGTASVVADAVYFAPSTMKGFF
jgi:phage gp36-like protein